MQNQRRDFLKITAAGAAGLALARADRAFAAWPATGTLAVNSAIDNMRVVACVDTKMLKTALTNPTFASENAAVDSARVQANMDAMAMQLANQTTADAAWKAIFRSSKAWNATKVAIKINTIEPKNQARIAVVQKFCQLFLGFGVLPANIIVYDGNTTYAKQMVTDYSPYFSLTDTTKIQAVVSSFNDSLGGTINAAIPGGNPATAACTADIANGTIDILVNIANNKGHTEMGGATLSMKNHFGTFAPNHGASPAYIFNINKSDAILGGTPVRQQLCFIDSIIANKASNTGTPEVAPCYLIMGVFGPAVDYLTVKKVREAVMNCTHTETVITSYLTTFGYTTTDAVWVVVPAAGGTVGADGGAGGAGGSGGSGGSGGASGSGGGSGGGTSGAGGTRTGGTSGSAGAGGGGTSGAGGTRSGGTSGAGGAGSGGGSAVGGSSSMGGSSATGGETSGGTSGAGGASATGGASASSGATASGGVPSGGGGATSGGGGAGGTGGAATSAASAAGGSPATAGTKAGGGTTASPVGGSDGNTGPAETAGTKVGGANSGSGCAVAGGDRRVTRWGAMLALGAVVAAKLRRLVSGDDQSS